MAEIERMERMSGSNGGDVNRGGRSRRLAASANWTAKRGGGRGSSGQGRQFRGGGLRIDGGGSRKADARGGGADFFYEGDFSPSSGSESEYLYDRSSAPPSSPAPRGGSPVHRFNVNAPSFRPSPGATSSIGLSASAPAIPNDPLPSEVPPEEPRRRDKKGRKKMTRSAQLHVPANFLLNFTYQRPTVPDWTPARRRTPVVEFKKERFLQANYRFVVNAGGEYVRHLYETDQLVDWTEIEQIVLQTPVPYNCPICLDAPMAPKMTKCGHIYCWSCINRYLGMAQKGWRKCPICFDSVSTKHLKSTSIEIVKEYHEGDSITFTLMRRHKDCTVALPSEHWRTMETLLHHDDQDSAFSRLVLVDDITPILDKEQQDLNENLAQARALHDYEPVPFIEGALYELQERRQEFAAKKKTSSSDAAAAAAAEPQPAAAADNKGDKPKPKQPKQRPRRGRSGSATSESEVSEYDEDEDDVDVEGSADESEDADHEKKKKTTTGTSTSIMASPDIYYFYQASDGQNIFMHPLNFRCLHKEVGGSFDKLPAKVEAKVLQLEEITQNEKMRKRRKMIVGHLPLSTQFQFCEIEMSQAGLASDKTLAAFADEFKFREAKRALIRREREADRDDDDSEKKKKTKDNSNNKAVEFPGLNEEDPMLAAALEESQRMADEQAAAEAARATPPVSIPTTPATASSSSSSGLSESPSGALQGAWAKKQLATATSGITTSSSSSSSSSSKSSSSSSSSKSTSSSSSTSSSRTTAKTPTFSQVAKNEVWSGWNEEAFPTVEAAANQAGGAGGGKKGGGANGAGAKGKKKKILLVSNAGGRRY